MRCPKCGTSVTDEAEFCPECGAQIVPPESSHTKTQTDPRTADARAKARAQNSRTLDVIMISLAALIVAAGIGVYFIWRVIPEAVSETSQQVASAETDLSGAVEDKTDTGEDASFQDTGDTPAPSGGGNWAEGDADGVIVFTEALHGSRVTDVNVFVKEGSDQWSEDLDDKVTLDGDGKVNRTFEDGPYTVSWNADGYYNGYANVYVRDGVLTLHQNLLPVATGSEAYVFLEWKGDDDLDLCLFNANTSQYVSIISPMDDEGNFLYADNGIPARCEVVRVYDFANCGVLRMYVRDGEDLKPVETYNHSMDAAASEGSRMEEDGVRISVYTAEGKIYDSTAYTFESAALWSPAYLYKGQVYNDQNYLYDRLDYDWAVYDKHDESTFSEEPIRLSEEMQGYLARVAYGISASFPVRDFKSTAQLKANLLNDPTRIERLLWHVYYEHGYTEYDGEGGGVIYHFSDVSFEEADRLLSDLFGIHYDFSLLPHDMTVNGAGILWHDDRLSCYSATPRYGTRAPEFVGYADFRARTDFAIRDIDRNTGEEFGRVYLSLKRCGNSFGFDIIGCQIVDAQE